MPFARNLRYARRYKNWREVARAKETGTKPTRVELRNGVQLESPENTNVVRPTASVYFKKVYSPRGFEIGTQDTVVDIGANFGSFTVYAAKKTMGKVLAIEPHPENVRFLRQNLNTNRCQNAIVVECALSDREGSVDLFPGHSGTTHQLFGESRDVVSQEALRVRSAPLGTLLDEAGIETIDFLKIDCEGAEGLFLPQIDEPTFSRIGRIAMEFHDETSPMKHDAIEELFRRHGFTTRLAWDGHGSEGMLYASR